MQPLLLSIIIILVVVVLLPSPTEARSSTSLLLGASSYTTILGLATQSARWKQSMERHLVRLAEKAAEATAWQGAATEDEAAAKELEGAAVEAAEEGEMMEEQATALFAKADADEVEAATTQEQADGLTEQATAQQGQAGRLSAEAAAEEAIVEEDTASATAEAAVAAEETTTAEVDEAATGFCQAIPVLDVVCDVVGGVAAVAMETQSARAATLAAEEYTAAVAGQGQVDALTEEAAGLETTATEEFEESATLESDAAALEAEAQEEYAQGQAEEAAAQEELAQSAVDQEASEGEEMKALSEEEASGRAWAESTKYGAAACWDALLMTAMSAMTGIFFVTRIASSILLPVLSLGTQYVWMALSKGPQVANTSIISGVSSYKTRSLDTLLATSHVFHHGLLFLAFFGIWGDYLLQLRHLSSIKGMGGIVILFAFSLAATQSILMHSVPLVSVRYNSINTTTNASIFCLWLGAREFGRRFLVFFPLIVMELLLLWVNLGKWIFVPTMVERAQQWYVGSLLAMTLLAHYFVVHYRCLSENTTIPTDGGVDWEGQPINPSSQRLLQASDGNSSNDNALITDYGSNNSSNIIELEERRSDFKLNDQYKWESIEIEEEALISEHAAAAAHSNTTNPQERQKELWFHQEVAQDMKALKLLLLFDLLMASVMVALILQATPTLWKLWPASKTIVMSAHPHWHVIVVCGGVAALAVLVCACL